MKRFVWAAGLVLALPLALAAQFSGINPDAIFSRYNSGANGAIPVVAGDTLGRLTFRALTGTNQYQTGASILAYISGNVTPNNLPSSLLFRTGLTTATNRMILTGNGRLGIGTMSPATSLHLPLDGYQIGYSAAGTDNFYVNSNTQSGTRGLRWYNGNFGSGNHLATLTNSGHFGIGIANPQEKLVVNGNSVIQGKQTVEDRLFVGTNYVPDPTLNKYRIFTDGGILCTEVKILHTTNWPDYVFAPDYRKMPLQELKIFIQQHNHLPNMPAAEVVHAEGFEIAGMQKKLLEKVEELTLYILEQQQEIDGLRKQLNQLTRDKQRQQK